MPRMFARVPLDNGFAIRGIPEYTGALAFNYDKTYTGTDPVMNVFGLDAWYLPDDSLLLRMRDAVATDTIP